MQVAPGEKFTLNISAIDQLGHTVYSIPSIKEIIKRNASDTNLVFAQQYAVVTPGKQKPHEISIRMPSTEVYHAAAEIQDEEYLEVAATYSNFLVKKRLIINTQKCHPGYKFNGRSCVCDTATPAIER